MNLFIDSLFDLQSVRVHGCSNHKPRTKVHTRILAMFMYPCVFAAISFPTLHFETLASATKARSTAHLHRTTDANAIPKL